MNSNLTPADVAARLNVPIDIVREMIRTGQLHAVRYSRKTIRVPVWSVEDHEAKERLFRIPVIRPNNHDSAQ